MLRSNSAVCRKCFLSMGNVAEVCFFCTTPRSGFLPPFMALCVLLRLLSLRLLSL